MSKLDWTKLRRDPLGLAALTLASSGGVGLIPFAPGTWGSLVSFVLILMLNLPTQVWIGIWVFLLLLGTLACFKLSLTLEDRDPSYVVIDEVVGMGLAGLMVQAGDFELALAAFILFRLFDIWKPGFIRRLDYYSKNHKNIWIRSFGIMLDDVAAGLLSLLVLYLSESFRIANHL